MSQMLLSINPKHVKNILLGTKRFEFRKVRCKTKVNKIIIYATAPIMRVVAEVEVTNVIEEAPAKVWSITADYSGISKDFFDEYFTGREKAIAYQLGDVIEYKTPKDLSDFGISHAPQSFVYV